MDYLKITSDLLFKLSESELRELKIKIDGHLSLRNGNKSTIDYELFYSCIGSCLQNVTGQRLTPFVSNKFKKTDTNKKISLVTDYINDWLTSVLKKPPTRAEKLRCYTLYGNSMVKYLQNGNIPVSLSTMLNVYEYFPGVFENMFPGYIKNNAAGFIFRKTE